MIAIYSLIDITSTGFHSNIRPSNSKVSQNDWNFQRNQERNWETTIQLLGLRSQPFDITIPVQLTHQRPAAHGFGWIYGSVSDVTIWKFTCRYEQQIDLNTLKADFNNVPIITGLNESILYPLSCFTSIGEYINIAITKL